MYEHITYCPHCNAETAILIDPSIPEHHLIEDCEVCGNLIEKSFEVRSNKVVEIEGELVTV